MDDGETDAGLAFEPNTDWEADSIREAAEALRPLSWDLGDNRAAFAEKPEVDLGGIGERLRPDDGGLRIGVDGDRLREDLAKLKEHEADLKLRRLLDEADRAFRAGRFEDAWVHAEAALTMAPTSVTALLLGARCRHALRSLDTALDLADAARRHARDANEVMLVVQLRDAVAFDLVQEVGLHANGLLKFHSAAKAVEYAAHKAARHPGIQGLHYVHGAALFRAGRLAEARDVIEALLAREDAADVEAFAELHQAVLTEICAPEVELARRSLRARRPKEAIDRLAACGDALQSNRRYGWLWSYAHERYAKSSKVPFVGWRRARRSAVQPLAPEDLQEVLAWLLAEEIDGSVGMLRKSDLDGAARLCVRAEAIDSRCGTVSYLHAVAETQAAARAIEQIDLPGLKTAERRLAVAAGLATKVADDPGLETRGKELAARIATDRVEVQRLTRFVSCVTRFNTLMTRYERRRISSREELHRVKRELRSIRAAADASGREHESGSSAKRTLDELVAAIESVLRRLPA